MQVLGKIPTNGEVAVPKELGTEGGWQRRTVEVVHVAFLQFVIGARQF